MGVLSHWIITPAVKMIVASHLTFSLHFEHDEQFCSLYNRTFDEVISSSKGERRSGGFFVKINSTVKHTKTRLDI